MDGSLRNLSRGGILSMDTKKNPFEKKPEKRVDGSLSSYKKIDSSLFPCELEDDGKPLKNEFLESVRIKDEKQKTKERDIIEDYKDKSYKEFVSDLLESSDDIFDSKGNDISKKEFLRNEMELD